MVYTWDLVEGKGAPRGEEGLYVLSCQYGGGWGAGEIYVIARFL